MATDAQPHFEWMQCMLFTCLSCSASQCNRHSATIPNSRFLLQSKYCQMCYLRPYWDALGLQMRLRKASQAPAEPSLTLSADPQLGESRRQEQSLLLDTFLQHILKYHLFILFSLLKTIQTQCKNPTQESLKNFLSLTYPFVIPKCSGQKCTYNAWSSLTMLQRALVTALTNYDYKDIHHPKPDAVTLQRVQNPL